MTSSHEPPTPERGISLSTKLVLLVAGSLVLVGVVALAFVLPASRQQFIDRTEDLLVTSHDGMQDIADRLVESHQSVVIELATHISDTYTREIADLPLSLARGDDAKIRSMILEQVGELRRRTIQNVEVIGEELQLRSEADVALHMEEQRDVQREKNDQFSGSLRRGSIGFVVFFALAPLPVLLIGLYRMVVRPLTSLAAATGRARTGDLSFHVPVSSRDEIGFLQGSFNRMIRDLEESNATLERRVEEKTADQKQALEEQQEATRRLEVTLGELRTTQDQLIHAEKMAGLGNLSASVAHEFNNLLGGILGSADTALEEAPSGDVKEALEVVRRAARRACVITDNLLRFSRKEDSHKEPADLNALVRDSLALLEPELRGREIHVETSFGELPLVPLDAGQMHQVLLNLLTNAANAIDRGGRIEVRTLEKSDHAELIVADDGPGVPAAERSRIFEPFFTTRRAGEGGTGLGLSVSYGIITGHGGRVEVDEREGGGALFRVELPLAKDEGNAS